MNTATDTDYQEYQATMQTAGLSFLQHLVGSLEVPLHMAEKLISRAYGELKSNNDRHQLDVDASSGAVAVITDPASGMTWAVPVSLIYQRIINAPENRRLRLVTP
jgi:hypothetical protein